MQAARRAQFVNNFQADTPDKFKSPEDDRHIAEDEPPPVESKNKSGGYKDCTYGAK